MVIIVLIQRSSNHSMYRYNRLLRMNPVQTAAEIPPSNPNNVHDGSVDKKTSNLWNERRAGLTISCDIATDDGSMNKISPCDPRYSACK